MDLSTITVADFKAFFSRDFPFAPTGNKDLKYVQDADITRAFTETLPNFNQALYPDDATIQLGFLLLAAHYLVTNLQSAAGGMGGAVAGIVSARSVGNVSETYAVSKAFLDNPRLGFYAKTSYGLRWLELITPYLVGGGVGVVYGTTVP